MADLDASLMQRLDEDSATNHKLMESLKATQVGVCCTFAFVMFVAKVNENCNEIGCYTAGCND